jgi:hypothetical protein
MDEDDTDLMSARNKILHGADNYGDDYNLSGRKSI